MALVCFFWSWLLAWLGPVVGRLTFQGGDLQRRTDHTESRDRKGSSTRLWQHVHFNAHETDPKLEVT